MGPLARLLSWLAALLTIVLFASLLASMLVFVAIGAAVLWFAWMARRIIWRRRKSPQRAGPARQASHAARTPPGVIDVEGTERTAPPEPAPGPVQDAWADDRRDADEEVVIVPVRGPEDE